MNDNTADSCDYWAKSTEEVPPTSNNTETGFVHFVSEESPRFHLQFNYEYNLVPSVHKPIGIFIKWGRLKVFFVFFKQT